MERYRFHPDGAVFYVTFTVVDWLPVFVSEKACSIITNSLNFCHQNKGLRVNAYVIMPTHLHAIVFHESFSPQQLENTLIDFRKFTGRRLSDYCCEQGPNCFADVLRVKAGEDRQRRFWQSSRHPVQIETERFWQQKIDYLHDNPCRKGFVRYPHHWRFSSASYWLPDRPVPNDVTLSGIDW